MLGSAFAVTALPEIADAQQCTSDNSDNRGCAVIIEGPNQRAQREQMERQGMTRPGSGGAASDAPRFPGRLPLVDTYFAVASHPGAKEHWAIWKNQVSLQNSEARVLAACNAAMRSGCQLVGSGKNSLVLFGYQMDQPAGPQFVDIGVGRNVKEAKQNLTENCQRKGSACIPKVYFATGPETAAGGFDFSMIYDPSKKSIFYPGTEK